MGCYTGITMLLCNHIKLFKVFKKYIILSRKLLHNQVTSSLAHQHDDCIKVLLE